MHTETPKPTYGWTLLCVAILSGPAAAQVTRSSNPADAYGYTLLDQSDPECAYLFVDISATGTPVSFTPSGGAAAEDDGGAAIALAGAFELYGAAVPSVVMSTNGYLGVAAGLAGDDGGDFSNDAVLPAVPGEEDLGTLGDEPRANARLLVYHDDLSGTGGGAAYHEHFASCPRPAASGLDEACTVFQWDGWGFANRADTFSFQAVLYHTSHGIVFQAGAGDTAEGASATLGIQDARCDLALQHRASVPAETALCFFEPRFPVSGPSADLAIEVSDGTDKAVPGTEATYRIEVSHAEGPSPVAGATVSDSFPESLTDCTWTCSSGEGAVCTAAGSGDISDTVTLPVDASVTYVATCTLAASLAATVSNTASVALPAGFSDPDGSNNSATDIDQAATAEIFADGFESGGTSAWNVGQP